MFPKNLKTLDSEIRTMRIMYLFMTALIASSFFARDAQPMSFQMRSLDETITRSDVVALVSIEEYDVRSINGHRCGTVYKAKVSEYYKKPDNLYPGQLLAFDRLGDLV